MTIRKITTDDLRRMTDSEGLVLQGCGGDLDEWADGINLMLTREGILKNGTVFTDVSAFEHDGRTNLLFNMDGVDLDIGRLAMWRLKSRETFGGTWLSDYRVNALGVSENTPQEKQLPNAPIIGADGNVFSIIGIASRTLKDHGLRDEAKEMSARAFTSGSYDEALGIIMEYVNPVSAGGDEDEDYSDDEDQGMTMQ
ncbi:MAG: hypothetical protein LBT21_02435 [Oscillospiraceae bacterium]|jgi:hypothetical protein|nr:hypothetical protein [Oscillospiraceae bacterium]